MLLSNNALICEEDRLFINDENDLPGFEFLEVNQDYINQFNSFHEALKSTDIKNISAIYPELKSIFVNVNYDYLITKEGEAKKLAILALPEVTSSLNSIKASYTIKTIDNVDYIKLGDNCICFPLAESNDCNYDTVVFLSKMK